jgi:hypothetical protein
MSGNKQSVSRMSSQISLQLMDEGLGAGLRRIPRACLGLSIFQTNWNSPGGYSLGHTHPKSTFIYATVLEGRPAARSMMDR